MVKRISVRKRKVSKTRRRSSKRRVSKTRRRSSKRRVSKTRRRSSKRKVSKTRRRSGKRRVSRRKQQRGGMEMEAVHPKAAAIGENLALLKAQLKDAVPTTEDNSDTRREALIKAHKIVKNIKKRYKKNPEQADRTPDTEGAARSGFEFHPNIDWGESNMRKNLRAKVQGWECMQGVKPSRVRGRGRILTLIGGPPADAAAVAAAK